MTTNDLAKRLVSRRAEMGMSQSELARVTGVAPAQISRYEAGKSQPSPQVISKLAQGLLCTYEWLAEGIGDDFIKAENEGGLGLSFKFDGDMAHAIDEASKSAGITAEQFTKALLIFNMHMLKFDSGE